MSAPLLDVRDLSIEASKDGQRLGIVDRVSFSLATGEILGLVGESGSGKTVTCRALMRLFPTASLRITGGAIEFAGRNLVTAPEREMREIRGGRIGMIFQNPASHLDPVMRIGRQISESLVLHLKLSPSEAKGQAIELLRQVGIPDPQRRVNDYPHQFSGGMRQRAMIALALACAPDLLIADEPTTALDVTVQAQILRLLLQLRDKRGLSIILITHDLGVVAQTCDSIAVMYGGRICERGPKRDVLAEPFHPYTSRLIACQPSASDDSGLLPSIQGQPPLPSAWPAGCRFHPRCDRAISLCQSSAPELASVRGGHVAACHVTAPSARTDEAA
ncbi:MAG: ABC transporter ATP-binding protein [Hyphomicrobiales bacterium]